MGKRKGAGAGKSGEIFLPWADQIYILLVLHVWPPSAGIFQVTTTTYYNASDSHRIYPLVKGLTVDDGVTVPSTYDSLWCGRGTHTVTSDEGLTRGGRV